MPTSDTNPPPPHTTTWGPILQHPTVALSTVILSTCLPPGHTTFNPSTPPYPCCVNMQSASKTKAPCSLRLRLADFLSIGLERRKFPLILTTEEPRGSGKSLHCLAESLIYVLRQQSTYIFYRAHGSNIPSALILPCCTPGEPQVAASECLFGNCAADGGVPSRRGSLCSQRLCSLLEKKTPNSTNQTHTALIRQCDHCIANK